MERIGRPGRAMCYDCLRAVDVDVHFAPGSKGRGSKLLLTGWDEMRVRDLEAA